MFNKQDIVYLKRTFSHIPRGTRGTILDNHSETPIVLLELLIEGKKSTRWVPSKFLQKDPIKKILYFVESKHLDETNTWNGIRTLEAYSVVGDKIEKQFEIEALSDDLGEYLQTNEEELQQYLDDNGMGDVEYDFVQL